MSSVLRIGALLALLMAAPVAAGVGDLPGAPPWPKRLVDRVTGALAASEQAPRTRHLDADGAPRFTNRLLLEKSPYLQQHAHNPVDWYPWGEEAFAAAVAQNKPILLSIGYSTCHWCHVMEAESFDNVEIATYINRHYIAIKVDREERPDIDRVFMAAVETYAGRGGWPATLWLTPDGQPFYASIYLPPYDGDRGIERGFSSTLELLRAAWADRPDDVVRIADQLVTAVQARLEPAAGSAVPAVTAVDRAFAEYRAAYDAVNGGLAGAPKFPSHLPVRFLLRYYVYAGDAAALDMAVTTLAAMADGGLNDHVGGGFHRYATDAAWAIPHFEKMLYDNALLATAYLEAFEATGDSGLAAVARATLRYVEREMTADSGAFYTASDADSGPGGAVEGWYYTWPETELERILAPDEFEIVRRHFGVTAAGDLGGRNVLYVAEPLDAVAQALGLSTAEAGRRLEHARTKLYRHRSARPAPFRDQRILTAWNGLMISAFARAGRVFGDDGYLRASARAARFVVTELMRDGRLGRAWSDGRAGGVAFADDYAYTIQAFIDLYEADGELAWLERALALQAVMDAEFYDASGGGYFYAAQAADGLPARDKPAFDDALPSANAVAVLNLLRLYELTTEARFLERAEASLESLERVVSAAPAAVPDLLQALLFHARTVQMVVLVTPGSRSDAEPFLEVLRGRFHPWHVLSVVPEGPDLDAHARVAPLLEGKRAIGGRTTAFVCEHGICDLPTADPAVFAGQLHGVRP